MGVVVPGFGVTVALGVVVAALPRSPYELPLPWQPTLHSCRRFLIPPPSLHNLHRQSRPCQLHPRWRQLLHNCQFRLQSRGWRPKFHNCQLHPRPRCYRQPFHSCQLHPRSRGREWHWQFHPRARGWRWPLRQSRRRHPHTRCHNHLVVLQDLLARLGSMALVPLVALAALAQAALAALAALVG